MRNSDELFKKCERDGEEHVRKKLAEKIYCTHEEVPIIEEWLRRKDLERANASISEELRLAREANSIARDSNSFARKANRIAKKANIIAIIASVIAIISFIISILT